MQRALILGIGGQDGSYLAEILLENGYDEVHGLVRHSSTNNTKRIDHIRGHLTIHRGDICDSACLHSLIGEVAPHEVYNMADQDNVGWSHSIPSYTVDVTYRGVVNILEAIAQIGCGLPYPKFFQPVSATMFGVSPPPQNEHTPFDPRTPYAVAKTAAYHICQYYRDRYNMFVCTGIMYNHDSPRRSEDYLVNTICRQAIRVQQGKQETISLGNLDLLVDVGHAKEYMQAAYDMMQLDESDNFVIGIGQAMKIGDLARCALSFVRKSPTLLSLNDSYYRSNEPVLVADISHAKADFGFKPVLYGHYLIKSILEEMSR